MSTAIWAVVASVFALIASIKFHKPAFLADCAMLTYGRVRPAFLTALIYGFSIQAALGVGVWILSRLSRTGLVQPWLVFVGSKFWNLGVLLGVAGILCGHGSGFEYLDMPHYSAWVMMIGYVLMGISAILTFHARSDRTLAPSQWFLLAALFWFPWIFSTAQVLVVGYPVRGVAQAAIWWWYQANLGVTFFTLAGLGIVFYFIPKLTNSNLGSRYLSLFAFWMVILFSGWTGIPNSAPLPAWMPTLSTITAVISVVTILTVAMNFRGMLGGKCSQLMSSVPLQFIGVGMIAYVLGSLLQVATVVADVNHLIGFTWLTPALAQLNYYGFFSMIVFGGIYVIIPQIMGQDLVCPKLMRAHFWFAFLGLLISVVSLGLGGVLESPRFSDPNIPFVDILKGTFPFLRASTMGDLFMGVGHLLLLLNLVGVTVQYFRPKAKAAYGTATAELFTTEARS